MRTRRTAATVPRELTARSVALGLGVGMALTAAITYLALYSGVAISAAIPAAVLCTGIMRVAMRGATVLENNLAQTIASSGEALAVGIVFTMPALVLAGVRDDLSYWEITLVCAFGGILGVLFVIPLRRTLTLGSPELPFPESTAAAKIARAGSDGARSLAPMALAVLAGALFKALVSVVQVISGTVEAAVRVAGRVVYGGVDMSLALVGVGVIVGLEYSASMVLGSVLSWLVAIPLVAGPARGDLVGLAWDTWSTQVRYIGLGAMIVAALWSVVETRQVIGKGLRWAFAGLRQKADGRTRQDDVSPRGTAIAVAVTAVCTFLLMRVATGSDLVGLVSTVVVLVLVFVFTSVSGYTVGLIGNSNNPSSAFAICALLITALGFMALQLGRDAGLTAGVLFVAAFVCTASATAGDTAQHLKTGALLGASPRRQQIAQLAGVVVFTFVVAPIVVLLVQAYGLGTDQADALQAPQAVLFANLADMVFGTGAFPYPMLWTGAVAAVVIIAADTVLRRTGRSTRLYVMPVAIGMYLPLSLTVPMLAGALLPGVLRRLTRRRGARALEAANDRSTLLWSGLITGEALVGVGAAVPRWLGVDVPLVLLTSPILSLAVFCLVIVTVVHLSQREGPRRARTSRT
ncbi:oligopeptide transporter, OPT family [Sphaerisporangium rubeum]|uniref:Putative OPT family oligopeptide transporter n=1 Tax=Sphaerisporangium rubeum TaxID=321317 RepID=A0A7X0I8T6_9ACTN|nr:oligopeptide transporter, OPT family [Sphaerisporangium rubeum]MBB6470588.1 putative OPT family oligopeptide transporter [Sphaerisporangium rubeum]